MTAPESSQSIDNIKKRKMRHQIIELERNNVNTKSKTEKEMIKQISIIIETEVTSRY